MEKFDVMFSTDNRYIDFMLASLYSFLLNSKFPSIRVHIITSNFTLEDYKKIEDIVNEFSNVDLYFYPLENFDIEKYNISNWKGSQIANARLFFEEILKPHLLGIKNLLYLDSDTLTVSDLRKLNFYKDGLYAVKDMCLKSYYKDFSNLDTYYNSGVIFINVLEWLENGYQEKIIKMLRENNNNNNFRFPDQDVFNCALSQNIKQLPVSYNLGPYAYLFEEFFSKLYFNPKYRNIGYDEVKLALDEPKIIHSYGLADIKPWNGDFNPYYDEFMKYLLEVNPNFESVQLGGFKKIISNNPNLYRLNVLVRTYLPERIENNIKSLSLKCQQNIKKKF